MQTYPSLRKRFPSERVNGALIQQPVGGIPQKSVVSGGLRRIFEGLFGVGTPTERGGNDPTPPAQQPGLYHFHEGDLFTPGTGNYVFDAAWELPMKTLWGGSTNQAFLRTPNVWKVLQPPQVFSTATVKTAGIGGLVAGQMILQPLESEEGNG